MTDNIRNRVDFLLASNQEWKERRAPIMAQRIADRRDADSRPAQIETVKEIVRALYVSGNMAAISTVLDTVEKTLPLPK